jgi:hypothetical protein
MSSHGYIPGTLRQPLVVYDKIVFGGVKFFVKLFAGQNTYFLIGQF